MIIAIGRPFVLGDKLLMPHNHRMEITEEMETNEINGSMKKDGSFNAKKLSSWLLLMFVVAVVSMVSVLCFYSATFNGGLSSDNEKWGTFGDFFGGTLNPILSFMSLTAVLLTVALQSRQAEISQSELELSRKELQETRSELKRSASAQENTEKIQAKQSFETTLFNLIELHHKLASSLRFNETDAIDSLDAVDRRAFDGKLTSRVRIFDGRSVFDGVIDFVSYNCKIDPEITLKRYKFIQEASNGTLGHYFRNLYQIIKIIKSQDSSRISEYEKRTYASIVRSQLSTKELSLLFLNCLDGISDNGKFRNLLVEYNFLEHLPIQQLPHPFERLFDIPGAFRVSKEMVMEYRAIKTMPPLDIGKYFGGAFGKNRGVPYDLNERAGQAMA